MLAFFLFIIVACAYSIAAIAWIVAVTNLFRTIAHRRPGIPAWHPRFAYFPPNIIFFPDLLTDRGRLCRKRFTVSAVAFVAALALGAVVSLMGTALP